MVVYGMALVTVVVAFILIRHNFVNLKNHDEGTEIMVERAALIRSGSKTFLRREYRMVTIVVIALAVIFSLIQETFAGLCLLFGAGLVLIAEEIGMRGGTYGNVRTTNAARVTKAISRTLRIATLGGSISGFAVPAFGLLGCITIFLISWNNGPLTTGSGLLTSTACNVMAARLTAYSLGFSIVAMFNRVAGGTFTKSADIGNDIVSKGEFNLEEDDPRNVCSIADLIGDCVNDLAGNLSDLGESYVATLMSCIVISTQSFSYDLKILALVCAFPILLATGGLISSLISIMFIILKNRKRYRWVDLEEAKRSVEHNTADEDTVKALANGIVREGKRGKELKVEYSLVVDDPGAELTKSTFMSAIITVAIGFIGAKVMFGGDMVLPQGFNLGWASPMVAAILGIISSVAVGLLTARYTDTKHKYVQAIAKMAPEGHSFVVSEGMAVGNHSAFWPTIIIAGSIFFAFLACGFYGIGIAAVGVLSFVGTTISIDAFGPIADNAGGIAESCHLDESVREITDELDALGNTTAAIGKGNAIGAATYSTITMFTAFLGGIAAYDLNEPNSFVRMVCGTIIGMAVIKMFLAILSKNTINAAWKLRDEAESQLKDPEIFEGKKLPDYNKAIRIASDNAIGYMLKPSLLSVVSPIIVGIALGPMAVLGLLMGSTVVAIGEAFFNGNAGGAYDNAKKYIEMGLLKGYGKGSEAHKAAITGDMCGDIMKDVLAVCCDICIKIMATVSVALVAVFYLYHIF